MINKRIKELLATRSPDAPTNYESERKATILNKIIWFVLLAMTFALVLSMVLNPDNLYRYALTLLLLWPTSLALLAISKSGRPYAGALLYVSLLIVLIFGFAWTGGGMKGHGIRLLPIVVLFAGLTLGRREVLAFGLTSALGGLFLVLADHLRWMPASEPLGQSELIYWLTTATSILLLCYLENLSVGELRRALSESQQELLLRKESEEQLKRKNEKLNEIAVLQSHMVRRPVANVLGLVSLMKTSGNHDPKQAELIVKLEIVAKELDSAIRQVVQNTEEVESMTQQVKAPRKRNIIMDVCIPSE